MVIARFTSARRYAGRPRWQEIRIPTVCVADPQVDDYQGWSATADSQGVRLEVVASADEALRLARTHRVDLWVVNTHLPGLSGCELCGTLKTQSDGANVYLVADQYSAALEQAAWRAQATIFGVKPAHAGWLESWLSEADVRRRVAGIRQRVPGASTHCVDQPGEFLRLRIENNWFES